MGNFTLTLDLSALYAQAAPGFEVLVDGVVAASFSVNSNQNIYEYEFNSAGAVPGTIELRFNDNLSESGRSVAINDIKINGTSIAGSSLNKGLLLQNESASVDTAAESGSFGGVTPPGEGAAAAPPPGIGPATITGTNGRDVIDVLSTTTVNDVVDALGGDDWIRTWGGDDQVDAGAGHDRVYAGDGNDLVQLGDGDDYVDAGAGNDDLWGEDGNDRMYGKDGNDTMHGGLGNDTLHGGNDTDVLFGEEGDDILKGG